MSVMPAATKSLSLRSTASGMVVLSGNTNSR